MVIFSLYSMRFKFLFHKYLQECQSKFMPQQLRKTMVHKILCSAYRLTYLLFLRTVGSLQIMHSNEWNILASNHQGITKDQYPLSPNKERLSFKVCAKAETPVLWPPHAKSWLIGKDWCWEGLGQEEKGTTEDALAEWHHRLNGHEFEWTPGVGDGQGGGLVCCDSWGHKESDTTEQLNWTELNELKY